MDGPVSAEVISTDFNGMVEEGKQLADLHENIVVKVPMIKEGIKSNNLVYRKWHRNQLYPCIFCRTSYIGCESRSYLPKPIHWQN